MDYFRILKLEREPFSNSPDPGLFFNSKQHLEILQNLEISIRLKRGLSVITGDVGTGKTTISRQLIQRLSEDECLNYYLVLDPGFLTVKCFLLYILMIFSVENYSSDDDENTLKEKIKSYLFNQGVNKNISSVLIIDEGQKLPVFCLEALRELLNYETNDQKLLQIIIFAQKEFDETIAPLNNFSDRINYRQALGPLSFIETRNMIRYRVKRSSVPGSKRSLFTFCAFWAIYRFTKGYPRKVVNLCHHIILALIIQNRAKANWFLVRGCGINVFPELKAKKIGKALVVPLFLFAVLGVVYGVDAGKISLLTEKILAITEPAETVASVKFIEPVQLIGKKNQMYHQFLNKRVKL